MLKDNNINLYKEKQKILSSVIAISLFFTSAFAIESQNVYSYNSLDNSQLETINLNESKNATPSNYKFYVNNVQVDIAAYQIDGNNYVKLRDIAYILNGTEKQFNVTWNNNIIYLNANTSYNVVGGELDKISNTVQFVTKSTSSIYKDGDIVYYNGYLINGNNFYKLRDIAQSFNFEVSWDTGKVFINTTNQQMIYGIVAENMEAINQKCSFALIDTKTGNIIDNIFDFGEDGSYPQAVLSPSGRYVAFNKWIQKQDRELFIYDLENNISKQLTFESNGEINRISWLNDSTIIGVFCSHEKNSSGWNMFSFDIKTNEMKFLTNINSIDNQSVYFNGVKSITGQNKILFARGLETDYLTSWRDKKYKNALYICNSDGSNVKELLTFDDRTIGAISISPNNENILIEAFKYPENNNELECSDLYLYNLKTGEYSLLEDGTKNTEIEHWNLNWLDNNTVIYRHQSGWSSLDINTMKKNTLFSQNSNANIVSIIPKIEI